MKKQKMMVRWSIATASLIALFWAIWYLITGSVPVVTSIKMFHDWTYTLPFGISRWWDILIGPIWSITIVFLTNEMLKENHDVVAELVIGLLFGLVIGLVFGLVVGPVFGLGVGLLFGLVVGLDVGLGVGLDVGLDVGLGVELVSWLVIVLFFGLVVGLFFGLGVGLVFGLVVGLFFGLGVGLVFGLVVGPVFGLGVVLGVLFKSITSAHFKKTGIFFYKIRL